MIIDIDERGNGPAGLMECPCPICSGAPNQDLFFQSSFDHPSFEVDIYDYEDPECPPSYTVEHNPLGPILLLDWLENGELDLFGLLD